MIVSFEEMNLNGYFTTRSCIELLPQQSCAARHCLKVMLHLIKLGQICYKLSDKCFNSNTYFTINLK